MNKNTLTEDDKKKFVEFLNCVAKHAKFELNTEELINYFKLLSYMQNTLLGKINDNILEVKKVVDADKQ